MRSILLILILSAFCKFTLAQQVFSEGVIEYEITIDPPANQEGLLQYKGTYTITVKGTQVKEDIVLDNGYKSTLLYNYSTNSVHSLKKIGSKHIAIELDLLQLQKRRAKYEGYSIKEVKNDKEIAGVSAKASIITYKDGKATDIFYSEEWLNGYIVFDNFPGIKPLLLSFTNYNDDGTAIHFTAKKVNAAPVENAVFRIPTHYKIMSNSEYQQLSGK